MASATGRKLRSGTTAPATAPRAKSAAATDAVRAPAAAPDDLLHHRLRLGIVSALAGTESLTFVELRALLDASDGNLSVHARKLEDARYISCHKYFADRRPQSEYRIESLGKKALERYLDHMQAVIEAARSELGRR